MRDVLIYLVLVTLLLLGSLIAVYYVWNTLQSQKETETTLLSV